MTKEDAKKNSTDGRIYEMQREYLLNLKKGIAFQKAFMASAERLKWRKSQMRCKYCPAYWEDRDYFYGLQDWGCYCDPKSGSDQGREFANGDYGCNRKLPYIQKVMKEVEKEKKIEEACIVKQMGDMAKFFEKECRK